MPWSMEEGKPWLAERVVAHKPLSLLDIGVGCGTYATLLRDRLPGCVFIGVEVHEPYIDRFGLRGLYDELLVGDARYITWPTVDLVIMGDVLEHMHRPDALRVWEKARTAAQRAVFASVPLGVHPQGAEEGNEFERHLDSWTWAGLTGLPGVIAGERGHVLGVVEAEPALVAR